MTYTIREAGIDTIELDPPLLAGTPRVCSTDINSTLMYVALYDEDDHLQFFWRASGQVSYSCPISNKPAVKAVYEVAPPAPRSRNADLPVFVYLHITGRAAPDFLVEKLAALEHEQWAHWTRYMLENLTPETHERWLRQCDTPYAELSEKEKDSDREWALKVIDVLEGSEP